MTTPPLTTWRCDVCGQLIASADDGYVTWRHDEDHKDLGFKIIHRGQCDDKQDPSSEPLKDFLGSSGLARLLSFLSAGPLQRARGHKPYMQVGDMDGFVDFMRRVQTPFYEEARQKFKTDKVKDDYSDANEVLPYLPEYLERIAKE